MGFAPEDVLLPGIAHAPQRHGKAMSDNNDTDGDSHERDTDRAGGAPGGPRAQGDDRGDDEGDHGEELRLEEIPQGFDHVAIMGRITGNEADAYADNVAGNDPAPGTIVYTGDLEHGFTSERLSQVFGLDLNVTHANGRWNAYAV